MTYRRSFSHGVRLRFRRRERVPPLYGPPTVMQHIAQQLMRNYERQMLNLYARTNVFLSDSELRENKVGAVINIRMPSDFKVKP